MKNPKYKQGDTVLVNNGDKIEKGIIVSDAMWLDYYNKPDFYYKIMTEKRIAMSDKCCILSGGITRIPIGNELFQFYRVDENGKLIHGQIKDK
jgi:hypothetical protein